MQTKEIFSCNVDLVNVYNLCIAKVMENIWMIYVMLQTFFKNEATLQAKQKHEFSFFHKKKIVNFSFPLLRPIYSWERIFIRSSSLCKDSRFFFLSSLFLLRILSTDFSLSLLVLMLGHKVDRNCFWKASFWHKDI